MLADMVGCRPDQLPNVSPGDFAVSDWEYLEYSTGYDMICCLMGVWGMSVDTRCPHCGHYAKRVLSFHKGRRPSAFYCDICNGIWGEADEEDLFRLSEQTGAKYPLKKR